MIRKARAVWRGTGKDGKGELTTDSGVLSSTPYSFKTRFESELTAASRRIRDQRLQRIIKRRSAEVAEAARQLAGLAYGPHSDSAQSAQSRHRPRASVLWNWCAIDTLVHAAPQH